MRSITEWTLAGVIAVLACLFLAMIWPYLLPLLMGTILAALTRPMHNYLVRKGLGPKTSASLMTLFLLIVIAGPLSLFVTVAIQQAHAFLDYLTSQQESFSITNVSNMILEHLPFREYVGDPSALERQADAMLHEAARQFGEEALVRARNIPDLLLHFVLMLVSCFFVLVDGRSFLEWILSKAPLGPEARRELVRSFQNTAVSVIWATLAVAAAEAAIMAFAFLVLSIPGIPLAAGATFIFSWIPFVHSMPVIVGAMIYLYIQGRTASLIVMAFFALLAGVADQGLRALVLKGRQDMHPLLSLLAILGGIRVFGLLGVFVGPIVAAVLVSLLRVLP